MADPYAAIDAYWETPLAVCPEDEPRQLRELVRYATLAPNAHNTQPWQFVLGPRTVRIVPDFSRSLPLGDPGDRELWISLGCALELLVTAARRVGYAPQVERFPVDEAEASLRVTFGDADPDPDDPRFAAIPRRHSNRSAYDREPIPAADLAAIAAAADDTGVRARVLTSPAEVDRVLEVVRSGFAWQRSSREFRRELRSWIRFSTRSTTTRRDGLTARASGRPAIPDPLGRALVGLLAVTGAEEREVAAKTRSSSAVLVLLTDDNDRATWVRAGRALARLKLEATARGVVSAHLNTNWQWDATKALAQERLELGDAHPQVVIRLGHAAPLPHSPRRPLEAVLRTDDPA